HTCFFSRTTPQLSSTLFPYTTLFRSDRGAQVEQQPVGAGVKDEPHLVGQRRSATGSIGCKLRLVLLDQVLGLSAGAVDGLINMLDRKSTRLNSSHVSISYAVFCLKKK